MKFYGSNCFRTHARTSARPVPVPSGIADRCLEGLRFRLVVIAMLHYILHIVFPYEITFPVVSPTEPPSHRLTS